MNNQYGRTSLTNYNKRTATTTGSDHAVTEPLLGGYDVTGDKQTIVSEPSIRGVNNNSRNESHSSPLNNDGVRNSTNADGGTPNPPNGAGTASRGFEKKSITFSKNKLGKPGIPDAKPYQDGNSPPAEGHDTAADTNDNRRDSARYGDGGRKSVGTATTAGTSRRSIGVATPPDGGWGWVVVVSSFAISMLVDGVCFSFGVYFDEFREDFESGKAATSWVGSVLNGTYLLIGPIVSALVNVYGCQRVALSGAVIASIAFFISTYSTTLGMLIFTYGFLGGFGFGLMYLPAIVMVGYYFERRRALATGMACCGSGMGAFIFAPISEILINNYGWRGATWIVSGLVLNGVIFALFYRPLPENRTYTYSASYVDSTESDSSLMMPSEMAVDLSPTEVTPGVPSIMIQEMEPIKKPMRDSQQREVILKPPTAETKGLQQQNAPAAISSALKEEIAESLQPNKKINPRTRTRSETVEEVSNTNKDLARLAWSQDFGMIMRKRHDSTSTSKGRAASGDLGVGSRLFGSAHTVGVHLSPLARKDIFYSGSLMHLQQYTELDKREGRSRFIQEDKSSNHSMYEDFSLASNAPTSKSFSEALTSIFDLSLLKSPTFLVYGGSCFLCMLGFFVPFVYMPAHAIDLGLGTRNAAFLISIIGITNTLGRVGVGFISDQPWADCLLINNVALVIGGGATVFVPYLPSYILLAIYAAVFGTSVAVFVSLRSIIMVELMGLERLTTAFGLVIMCQGMSAFLGAPIAGILSDHYGNYDAAFCLAGVSLTLSGLICVPLRRIARWENERARQRDEQFMADMDVVGVTSQQSADGPGDSARDDDSGGTTPKGVSTSLKSSIMKKVGAGKKTVTENLKFGSEV